MTLKDIEKANEMQKEARHTERTDDNRIDNEFEVIAKLPRVHSEDIRELLSEDYTLANLKENEKTFIKENNEVAIYVRKKLLDYKKFKRHVWNDDKMDWERDADFEPALFPISKEEEEMVNKMASYLFSSYMIVPHSISILARNDEKNFLVKLIGNRSKEADQEEVMEEAIKDKKKGIKEKIIENI